MVRGRQVTVLLVSVLVAVGGAYWWWSRKTVQNGYVTAAVERGSVGSLVTATGTLNPVKSVQVGTYVSGPIQALYADFNSPVTRGQRVAKIDPAPFQVKVLSAEADVANARARVDKDRADLELKRLTLERNRRLAAQDLISQNDVDTAKSNYDQAVAQLALDQASVKQSEASLQEARINLAYTDITSPVDGVVVSRNVDVGQTVAASFQTPTLFLIAQDLTKMQVDANVSESDIGAVRAGQAATFSVDAYPGKAFQGTVAQVRNAPITVQNVVTYDVVIAVDNPDLELKPGMTATVNIITAQRDDVAKVPLRATRFDPERKTGAEATPAPGMTRVRSTRAGTSTVWLVQPNGALRRVEVTLGVRDDQFAELLSGDVKVGDQLAIAFRSGTQRKVERPPSFGGPRMR
ncbi:MAG: macA [Deltaproteobacteria bacterium]|jgi:HlyD family secretion protein|nr:macA [Deltaproteobacteria bacterium]